MSTREYDETGFSCGTCLTALDSETQDFPAQFRFVHRDSHRFECATGSSNAHSAELVPTWRVSE